MAITTVSPILADHAVPGPAQGAWTCTDWEQLPADGQRYEVIAGVLFMTTAPSNFHQWIVGVWIEQLGIPAKQRGDGFWFTAPIGVLLSEHDAVQPDFMFIRAERRDIISNRRIRGAPDLIVEVLSPGNSTEEIARKRTMYAHAGVPNYVEVDPATRSLAYYQLTQRGQYAAAQIATEADTVTLTCLPDLPLAVALLFADAPDTEP